MKRNLKESLTINKLFYSAVFAFMLVLNFLTLKAVDDYFYSLGINSLERISGLREIFESVYYHAFYMNGRLVSHFFAYLFNSLPKPVFNFINAGMFTLLVFLCCSFSRLEKKTDNLLVLFVFSAIWVFELSFGQVNLWLTGACNYLWAIVFALLMIKPYYEYFYFEKQIHSATEKLFFPIIALFIGAYNEVASSTAVGVSLLFLILSIFLKKRRPPKVYYYALAFAVIGYITIFLSPAESGKGASSRTFIEGLIDSLDMYSNYWPLLAAYVVELAAAPRLNISADRLFSSVVFLCGSLFANFILAFAAVNPGRCGAVGLVFLVIAAAVPAADLPQKTPRAVFCAVSALLTAAMLYYALLGTYDIARTYREIKTNEEIIISGKESGEDFIEVNYIYPASKYNSIYGLEYVVAGEYAVFPNENMATYYGVSGITGVEGKN